MFNLFLAPPNSRGAKYGCTNHNQLMQLLATPISNLYIFLYCPLNTPILYIYIYIIWASNVIVLSNAAFSSYNTSQQAWLRRTDSRQAHRRKLGEGTWCTLAPNQNNWHLYAADGHTGGITGGEGWGGREGEVGGEGGALCQFSFVSCLVCVRAHTVTSGPGPPSTNMSGGGSSSEATLHPSGHPQHCTQWPVMFSHPWGKTPAVLRLSWLVLKCFV